MTRLSHTWRPGNRLRLLLALLILLAVAGGLAPRHAAAAPPNLALDFSGGAGGVADTGFATTLPGTTLQPTNLQLGGGALQIHTAGGELGSSIAQENALAIQYASGGSYTIQARLLAPLPFAAAYQAGGIFIAQTGSSFIRLTAGVGSKRSTGERLQLDVADNNGKVRSSTVALPAGTLAGVKSWMDLFLTIDQANGRISALYRVDSSDPGAVRLATTRGVPRWMNKNNTQVYAGVLASSRAAAAIDVRFDSFGASTVPVFATISGSKTVDKDGISGPPVSFGDTLTYTINVTNNGPSATVTVVDPIPVDTTFKGGLSIAPNTQPLPVYSAATNRVTWSGTLGTGQSATLTFQVTVNQAPLQSSTILNTASMSTAGGVPAQLSASTVIAGAPDLSVSTYNATPAEVGPNGDLVYTLTLLNDGTISASNIVAKLAIPAGTAYKANSVQASAGAASIDLSLTQISWNVPSMPTDGSATLSFTVNVGSGFLNGDTIESNAVLQANGTLPSIETAQATYVTSATVTGAKSVDKAEADPGDILTYTIALKNTSAAPVTGLQVADPISQDTAYLGNVSTSPGAPVPTYDSGARQLSWQGITLAASQTITMSFQVSINGAGNAPLLHSAVILNRATLTGAGAQTALSATTVVRGVPDLTDSVYTASPGTVGPGGTLSYELDLVNSGTAAANNLTAQLSLPAGTALVGSPFASKGSISFDSASGKLNWSGSQLAIGGLVKITFQAKLTATPPSGSAVASQAVLQSDKLQATTKTAQAIFNQSAQAPQTILYLTLIKR
jgi:uncharacterized repeat protein (TIGR01451 family)